MSDVAIPVATSVAFICRAAGVNADQFTWKKTNFKSSDFRPVQQSNIVVIDNDDGESKLTFTETSFDKSGIYQCATSLYSAHVNLHVYGSKQLSLSLIVFSQLSIRVAVT